MLKRDMVSPSVTQRQSRGRCQYSSGVPMMEEPKSSFPITCLMVFSSTPGVSNTKSFSSSAYVHLKRGSSNVCFNPTADIESVGKSSNSI